MTYNPPNINSGMRKTILNAVAILKLGIIDEKNIPYPLPVIYASQAINYILR